FLMSAGIELPKRVMIHGFLNNEGEKMSKSVGNVVHPADWADRYGLDTVRFFLLREFPFGSAGSYSRDGVLRRNYADPSNNRGSLAQRSLSMVYTNLDAQVPQPAELAEQGQKVLDDAAALMETWRAHFEVQDFYRALGAAWKVLDDTNAYFADQQPWVLFRSEEARMKTVLWVTLEIVRRVALLVQPVMPESATKLLDALGVEVSADAGKTNASGQGPRSYAAWDTQLAPGTAIDKPTAVCPRHEEEQEGRALSDNGIDLALIPADGIGPEVTAEALKVLQAVLGDDQVKTTEYGLGAEHWLATGETLTDQTMEALRGHQAILFGAVGAAPNDTRIPSGLLEREILLQLRFSFDHAVNFRPSVLFPGASSPLANPCDIDFVVFREGTEGLYVGNGRSMRTGTAHEIANETSVNTAYGVERVVRKAFEYAQGRERQHVT